MKTRIKYGSLEELKTKEEKTHERKRFRDESIKFTNWPVFLQAFLFAN